ncbi:MAG: glycerol-3-phosphate 1-O-acyltransferase [Candidatus Dadabacteria bacterium]|nr:MAG: glycerol-3-phosphate 1-O-acyltransferase [Candidatus Dadabacteria bacterium]
MRWVVLVLFAYLLGSVPTGLVLAKAFGLGDPRRAGSGNIGATNVGRTLGKKWGVVTLVGDALKGFIPTALALGAFGSPWAVVTVGFAAYLGHLFPLYLGFRGGKGVATGLGVFLALAPGSVLWAAAVFALLVWRFRWVSLGSLGAAAALPLILAYADHPLPVVLLGLAVGALTLWKHRDNIERLLDGTEHRLGQPG